MVVKGALDPSPTLHHPSPPFTSNDFSAADKGKSEVLEIGIRLK